MSFEDLLREWDGEQTLVRLDAPTGAWMFICMHSTRLGPAIGGTRMKVYPSAADGLRDAMRLSAGMTRKTAIADLPYGGGKAVLAVTAMPKGDERRSLLLRYADVVESLAGTFLTGHDMNTSEADIDLIAERTPHVFTRSPERGGSGNASPATALGVLYGIRASVRHAFGSDDLAGRVVLIQGVGEVGRRLAELASAEGATVLVSDLAEERVRRVADELRARSIPPAEVIGKECDVFAPCAVGGVLNEGSIPRLRCRVVAGAANNQLGRANDAELLRERGILYAPDYVINAGGVLRAVGLETLGWDEATLAARLEQIGDTLTAIYERADVEGVSTDVIAARIADERVAGATPQTEVEVVSGPPR
jgi:leucine dehydrogenase